MITFIDDFENEILKPSQVARYLGVGIPTVRRYYRELGGFKVGPKLIRFNREGLRDALQKREMVGRPSETGRGEETEAFYNQGESPDMGGRRTRKGLGDPYGLKPESS